MVFLLLVRANYAFFSLLSTRISYVQRALLLLNSSHHCSWSLYAAHSYVFTFTICSTNYLPELFSLDPQTPHVREVNMEANSPPQSRMYISP